MGTKNNPGTFDCYANAEPDEPMFVLLARDPLAPILVEQWAESRKETDPLKAHEAKVCAAAMREWQRANRPDKTMHLYHCDDDTVVVAASADDARAVLAECCAHEYNGLTAASAEVTPWPDDKLFTMNDYGPHSDTMERTCAEWAAVHGRGHLGNTEY